LCAADAGGYLPGVAGLLGCGSGSTGLFAPRYVKIGFDTGRGSVVLKGNKTEPMFLIQEGSSNALPVNIEPVVSWELGMISRSCCARASDLGASSAMTPSGKQDAQHVDINNSSPPCRLMLQMQMSGVREI
jgi:hypothetical protein